MMIAVRLNEFSLLAFVLTVFRAHPFVLLAVAPVIGRLLPLFEKLAAWGRTRGVELDVVEFLPEIKRKRAYERSFMFHDPVPKYESWQNEWFRFAEAEQDSRHGYAYKQLTGNYCGTKIAEIHYIHGLLKVLGPDKVRFAGVDRNTLAMAQAYFRESVPHYDPRPPTWRNRLLSAAFTALIGIWCLVFTFVRLRLKVEPQRFFLAADHQGDRRDIAIYAELEEGGPVLVVPRAEEYRRALDPRLLRYTVADWNDGLLPLAALPTTLAWLACDLWGLWRRYGDRQPEHYYAIGVLPARRLQIAAFLFRFRPDNFLSRDDYNVASILRTQELRKIGARSIAFSHAILSIYASLFPQLLYVDFDVYLAHAMGLSPEYRKRWKSGIDIRSVDSFGLSRALRGKHRPCGDAILICIRVAWHEPEMLRIVRAIAAAFPARRLLLQFKAGHLSPEEERELVARYTEGLPNLEYTKASIYDLLDRAAVLISDVSTIIAEFIESGVPAFLADVVPAEWFCYRAIPEICVRNADVMLDRLNALDQGEPYPFARIRERMNLSPDSCFFDTLREATGLPPLFQAAAPATVTTRP